MFRSIKGSYGIWGLGFNRPDPAFGKLATVSHIVNLPNAQIVDGLEILNSGKGLILAADTQLGMIYTVNAFCKTATVTLTSPLFSSTSELAIGVDGIKLRDGELYSTNAVMDFFGKIPINTTTGYALDPAVKLPVQIKSGVLDDFIFDKSGNVYLTNAGMGQGMYQVSAPVSIAASAKFLTNIDGPTAARFGRTPLDENCIYVTSSGGNFAYLNQNFVVDSRLTQVCLEG